MGFGLVGLVDERKGAPLMARITGIRRQLSRELGFVVPMVRVRDDHVARPEQLPDQRRRRRRRRGRGLAGGSARARFAAICSSGSTAARSRTRPSASTRSGSSPASAPRRWSPAIPWSIPRRSIATHLNQVIQIASADLFGMDEAQKLVDALKENAPQLAANLTPQPLSLAALAASAAPCSPRACR